MSDCRLKILLTVHQFFPRHIHGTERYTLDLAKALQTLGHSVVVLTRNQHLEDCEDRDWNEYRYDGIRVLAVDLITHARHGFETSFDRVDLDGIYGEILFREHPDIIHCCHLLYLGANFVTVAACSGVPIIMTFTDFYGICWTNRLQTIQSESCKGPDRDELNCIQDVLRTVNKPFNNTIYDLLFSCAVQTRSGVRLLKSMVDYGWIRSESVRSPLHGIVGRRACITSHYRRASEFIVATPYLMNAYIKAGYPADKMRLMNYGIEQPSGEEIRTLRDRYVDLRNMDRPFIIGFIGQIARHKGLVELLEAFDRSEPKNARLHIYGDLKQDPKFTNVVEEIGRLNPLVSFKETFPGSQIYSKLALIDVLVIPSTWAENSPLVLLNALASRTMVVVSDVEGMSDLVQNGVNGRLVPAGDPDSLAKVLASLENERCRLLDWYDETFQSYAFSPLHYATDIVRLYRKKIARMPAKKTCRREDFPFSAPRAVVVTCTRLSGETPAMSADSGNGYRLSPHEMAIEKAPSVTFLRARSSGAHVILDCDCAIADRGDISLLVRWPRDGLSVVYYWTAERPEFCEAQKATRIVPAGVWCRLSIHLNGSTNKVTRLRWDPLYDALGLQIAVGWPLQEEGLVR